MTKGIKPSLVEMMHNLTPCEIGTTSDVLEEFLLFTGETCPYGGEDRYTVYLSALGAEQDQHGNFYVVVGDCDVMFTSHLDTADAAASNVSHRFFVCEKTGDVFVGTDGKTILGADCKAGVVAMCHMIRAGVRGLFYFFVGEEVGRIGSEDLAMEWRKSPPPVKPRLCVSFDRKAYGSIISHQMGQACVSKVFSTALASEFSNHNLPFAEDDGGSFTDSYSFADIISECTNISVGYFNQHTNNEMQNISYLERLTRACCKINWSALPSARKPSLKTTYTTGGWYSMPSAKEEDDLNSLYEAEYVCQYESDAEVAKWIRENPESAMELIRHISGIDPAKAMGIAATTLINRAIGASLKKR